MVIDTSALAAIALKEPDAFLYSQAIRNDRVRLISVPTALECTLVIESRVGEAGGRDIELFILRNGLELVSLDHRHLDAARRAFRKYGKGRHAAGLNFGDCFSYALAKVSGEPLLFKGDDFSQTDIRHALITS